MHHLFLLTIIYNYFNTKFVYNLFFLFSLFFQDNFTSTSAIVCSSGYCISSSPLDCQPITFGKLPTHFCSSSTTTPMIECNPSVSCFNTFNNYCQLLASSNMLVDSSSTLNSCACKLGTCKISLTDSFCVSMSPTIYIAKRSTGKCLLLTSSIAIECSKGYCLDSISTCKKL